MPRNTGLTSALAVMACLACGIASAADAETPPPVAPQSETVNQPEPASEKQPTPKEDTAGKQPNPGDSAKPKEDPNCE